MKTGASATTSPLRIGYVPQRQATVWWCATWGATLAERNDEVLAALRLVDQHMARVLAEEPVSVDSSTFRIVTVGLLARSHSAVRSVLLLHENGLQLDMVAAGRLLHETAIVARWISRKDSGARAEKYFLSGVLRTQTHLDITEKAHGTKLETSSAEKHRLALEAVAQRFPEAAGPVRKKGGKKAAALVPDLLTMAREETDLLHFYNFGFALHSIHAHCDPRSIMLAALPDMESTTRAGLLSALTASIRIINSCGALLGRTDHEPLVNELVPLVYRISGATPPGT